jgi:hypothetical protein
MKSGGHIQGPYREASSRGLGSRIASETMYAFGGVVLVVYLCYALILA